MNNLAQKTLGAILYPDFELLDLYGPLEMFGSLEGACRIVTVSDRAAGRSPPHRGHRLWPNMATLIALHWI